MVGGFESLISGSGSQWLYHMSIKKYESNHNLLIFLVLKYLLKSVNPKSYTKKLFFLMVMVGGKI